MQMEDERDISLAGPAHQLEAGRVTPASHQDIGPETWEVLVGRIERDRPLARRGRTIGPPRSSREQCGTHAIELQVENLGPPAVAQCRCDPAARPLQRGQNDSSSGVSSP
jgi:hypothetical protein